MAPGYNSCSLTYLMNTANKNISDIIYKHLQEGILSVEEQAALDQWLAQSHANRQLLLQLSNEEEWKQYMVIRTDTDTVEEAYEQFKKAAAQAAATNMIAENRPSSIHRVHFLRKWGWAAASILILLATSVYLNTTFQKQNPESTQTQPVPQENDVLPGSAKAILTMADGQKIRLDSTARVILAEKGIVNRNALISYSPTNAASAINTLTTPRGGAYKIKLSDGTMVWLNAASSITYPTVFTGSERTVKITGEAYLEVAKDKSKPFHVQVGEMNVQVLGTSFNINAYPDEGAIKTTLLEGSVCVNAYKRLQTLIPGQQAQVSRQKAIKIVKDADIDQVMAWKNGLFNFEGASLEEVMKQLERWYDIEVVYESGVPDIEFGGKLTKDISLAGLLKALEKSKVHFRIEGRKLMVLP
jgi:transmembrane sensor